MPVLPKLSRLVLLLAAAPALAAEEPSPTLDLPPLRYQAVSAGNGRVLVIDTATGQCWSKSLGEGRWRDEGNPTDSTSPNATTSQPGMMGERVSPPSNEIRSSREEESLHLSVRQRDRAAIPGASLFVHIGDITDGQTLVSVRDADGKLVAGEVSLSANEGVVFEWQRATYELNLKSLTNLLTGEDFAEFRLEMVPHKDEPGRPRTDSGYEPPRSDSARNQPELRRTRPPRSDSARSAVDPAAEARKIEALIEHVEGMTDAKFVRNGIEYDGPTAAAFLRGKWDANKSDFETAVDFIDKAATASSTTGQPYLVRLKDGTETKAADHLRAELERLANDPPR